MNNSPVNFFTCLWMLKITSGAKFKAAGQDCVERIEKLLHKVVPPKEIQKFKREANVSINDKIPLIIKLKSLFIEHLILL